MLERNITHAFAGQGVCYFVSQSNGPVSRLTLIILVVTNVNLNLHNGSWLTVHIFPQL